MGMSRTAFAGLLVIALLFFCIGLAFLPWVGFEYDEVIFIQPLFHPSQSFASIHLFHGALPLMQTSYAGALKTWIYAPIFKFCTPDLFSVRLPVLVLASITVFLLGTVIQRLTSSRAAIFACAVLVSDLNFLLASVFDWGPVVIQNFLLTTGLYLIIVQRKKPFAIPLAAFVCGLALWDKALFLWILSGLVLSGVVFGLRLINSELIFKRLASALIAFCIGAAPLLIYNFKHHGETFRGNTKLSFAEVGPKFTWLRIAMNDQALENFFVDRSLTRPPAPSGASLSILTGLTSHFHNASSGRFLFFCFLGFMGLLLARPSKRRVIAWLALAVTIAWLQAAMTQNAGASIHHIVLFYPVLFLALGICADEIAVRLQKLGGVFLSLATLGFILTGFGIVGAQYVDFHRFSPTIAWTDADKPLAQYLFDHRNRQILAADWGITSQADARTRGVLPMGDISFGLQDRSLTQVQLQERARVKPFIVLHTPEHAVFTGQNSRLASLVKEAGLALTPATKIQDQAGHQIFEIDELVVVP
jgi:4-amino-4-deoxy-L-arabinose transferase-like glycosyltransferase